MEETLTNWDVFVQIYTNIRPILWSIYFKISIGIIVFGLLRFLFKYAVASKIGTWENSSYGLALAEKLYFKFLADCKEEEMDRQDGRVRVTTKDGHPGGTLLDLVAWAIIGLILILTWPGIIVLSITFLPIQLCRNHFMKKKVFIANLKGKDVNL